MRRFPTPTKTRRAALNRRTLVDSRERRGRAQRLGAARRGGPPFACAADLADRCGSQLALASCVPRLRVGRRLWAHPRTHSKLDHPESWRDRAPGLGCPTLHCFSQCLQLDRTELLEGSHGLGQAEHLGRELIDSFDTPLEIASTGKDGAIEIVPVGERIASLQPRAMDRPLLFEERERVGELLARQEQVGCEVEPPL